MHIHVQKAVRTSQLKTQQPKGSHLASRSLASGIKGCCGPQGPESYRLHCQGENRTVAFGSDMCVRALGPEMLRWDYCMYYSLCPWGS